MENPGAPTDPILDPYLTRLRDLAFVDDIRVLAVQKASGRGVAAEAVLELETPSGRYQLIAEVKRSNPGHDVVRQLAYDDADRRILLVPYVGAGVGNELEQSGVNFIDRQGNCYVRLDRNYVQRVQSRVAPKQPARAKSIRAAGYQVLFALLAEPELMDESERKIAEAAGTSRRAVTDMLGRLVEQRFVVRKGKRHAWVDAQRPAALAQWVSGYLSVVRPKLMLGTFRIKVREPNEVERWIADRLEHFAYGGAAAAHRLGGAYRSGTTVVHISGSLEDTRQRLGAISSDEGNVMLMRGLGPVSWKGAMQETVHPLLVYSELEADPHSRAREAAEEFRERWLPWSL